MNQRDRIFQRLRAGEWLSLADALSMSPPIYRISERVREIRKKGYNIVSRRVEGKTYNEYKLIEEEILEIDEGGKVRPLNLPPARLFQG